MAWFWWLMAVIVVVLWIATIVNIIQRRHERTAGKTAAWIILVLVFPVLGTIVYFLVNGASGPVTPTDTDVARGSGRRI